MPHPDILILGGGILGLATARELHRRGASVALVEARRIGGDASAASAGMLAPLAEVPTPGPFFDLCRLGRDLWPAWAASLETEVGVDVDLDRSGAFILDEGTYPRRLLAAAQRLGEPWEHVDRATSRASVPDLRHDVEELLFLPGEHRVDNVRVCAALETALRRRGVPLFPHHPVRRVASLSNGVRVEGDGFEFQAGGLVVTAGAWSGGIDGLPVLPVKPVRGQMLRFDDVDWPFMGCLRGGHLYAVRRRGQRLLIGATVEDVGFDSRTTPEGRRQLLAFAERHFPGLAPRRPSAEWAGLRPAAPDHLPIVGPLGDRIWAATAHHRNGILLAPWTAEAVAQGMLADGASAAPWRAILAADRAALLAAKTAP
ncbi:MAG: FAD-dependent oxidoreductase [Acidobacteriota bacterium]